MRNSSFAIGILGMAVVAGVCFSGHRAYSQDPGEISVKASPNISVVSGPGYKYFVVTGGGTVQGTDVTRGVQWSDDLDGVYVIQHSYVLEPGEPKAWSIAYTSKKFTSGSHSITVEASVFGGPGGGGPLINPISQTATLTVP